MRRDPSIIYAILLLSLFFFFLYGFFDIDEMLETSTAGKMVNFFVLLLFGILPILGLIQATLYEYSNTQPRERLAIVKRTMWHLWQWLRLKKTW